MRNARKEKEQGLRIWCHFRLKQLVMYPSDIQIGGRETWQYHDITQARLPYGTAPLIRNVYTSKSWQHKTTTFCTELTSHSPPPTPLLPALTPSAGELKVSR